MNSHETVWFNSFSGNTLVVNGQSMNISSAEIKGTPKIGASAKVEGYFNANGAFVVTKIEFQSSGSDGAGSVNEDGNKNNDGNDGGSDNSGSDDGGGNDGGGTIADPVGAEAMTKKNAEAGLRIFFSSLKVPFFILLHRKREGFLPGFLRLVRCLKMEYI